MPGYPNPIQDAHAVCGVGNGGVVKINPTRQNKNKNKTARKKKANKHCQTVQKWCGVKCGVTVCMQCMVGPKGFWHTGDPQLTTHAAGEPTACDPARRQGTRKSVQFCFFFHR
jgi:hypothetical protein